MKKFIPISIAEANSIKVNVTHVYIPKNAFLFLGKPERVDFYYDVEKNAIKIVPGKLGLLFVKSKGHQVNCQLSKIMPKGAYIYDEDNKIYVFAE